MKKVIIYVEGGVAYIEKCPEGVEVEIIDIDNYKADTFGVIREEFSSGKDAMGVTNSLASKYGIDKERAASLVYVYLREHLDD